MEIPATLPPVNYEADVLSLFNGRSQLPKQYVIASQVYGKDWWWYCDMCLVKQTWEDFRRGPHGWPIPPCHTCRERIYSLQSACGFRNGLEGAKGNLVGRSKLHKIARSKVCLANDSATSDWGWSHTEAIAKVALETMGGAEGLAEMVRRLINDPTEYSKKRHLLTRAVLKYLQSVHELEKAREQTAAVQSALAKKANGDLGDVGEDELREMLQPMFTRFVQEHPGVAVKVLKDQGYVVGKSVANLSRQILGLPQAKRERLLRDLLTGRTSVGSRRTSRKGSPKPPKLPILTPSHTETLLK